MDKPLINMGELSIAAFLLAVILIAGLAWAQVGDMNPNESGKPFLNPYSPANRYQSLDDSQKPVKPYTKSAKKMVIKPMNIGKNAVSIIPTNHSNASIGKSEEMKNRPAGPKIGAIGNSMSLGGGHQHSGSGSQSFLDGYFLKSLHDDKMTIKRAKSDNTANNNLHKDKNKSSFIK